MKNKFGLMFMGTGAVLIIAALSLFGFNMVESNRAASSAESVRQSLNTVIIEAPPEGYKSGEIEIDGNKYIGSVYIEPLNLRLPVMSDWSYSKLKISPCRYSGAPDTDDMVIMAHNYSRHFGKIKNLKAGDDISFTDIDGNTIAYKVEKTESLTAVAVEDMTAGEYDLTLFTCTYSGESRVTVRCNRAR